MNLRDIVPRLTGSSKRVFLLYVIIVAFAITPVWSVKYYVSQDGIAHVYNAFLMNELVDGNRELSRYLSLNSLAVPNSTGHWLLVLLLRIFSPFTALKILATVTFACFVASIGWLWASYVPGGSLSAIVIVLGAALAFNWMWFLGFYNFTIGVIGFICCLAMYLRWHEKLNFLRTLLLSIALTIAYLSHIVPFVMAIGSLLFLAVFSNGVGRIRTIALIAGASLPALTLAVVYRVSVGISESFTPAWRAIGDGSISAILDQLRRVDPFALISRTTLPFTNLRSWIFVFLAPTLWIIIAIVLLLWPTLRDAARAKFTANTSTGLLVLLLGWAIFSVIGPDDFGITNGGILRDRVMLCGVVFAVPLMRMPASRVVRYAVTIILAVVVIFQTSVLWEYSSAESSIAAQVVSARSVISDQDSIITISVVADGMRFHSVPEPNLGVILGLGRDTLIWDNYELAYTLFPIRTNTADDRQFYYRVSISHAFKPNDPKEHFNETFARLTDLLESDHQRFSRVVLLGSDARIESLLATWYNTQPIYSNGGLRVFKARDQRDLPIDRLPAL